MSISSPTARLPSASAISVDPMITKVVVTTNTAEQAVQYLERVIELVKAGCMAAHFQSNSLELSLEVSNPRYTAGD